MWRQKQREARQQKRQPRLEKEMRQREAKQQKRQLGLERKM